MASLSSPQLSNHISSLLHSLLNSSKLPRHHLKQIHAQLFKLHNPTILLFNSLIRDFTASKSPSQPISIYLKLLRSHIRPNNFTFPFLIKSCCVSSHCRQTITTQSTMLHAHIVRIGLETDPYVQSTLIHMYASVARDIVAARRVFELCSGDQVVCFNSMIDGFVKCGDIALAREVFDGMQCPDVISWNTMINGYSLIGNLGEARKLFDRMPKRSLVSWNSMLAGYAKCGGVEGARRVFLEMPSRDLVSWNTMLASYAQSRCCEEAFAVFDEMRRAGVMPTDATVVSMVSVCGHLGALDKGEWLHGFIEDHKIKLNTGSCYCTCRYVC